MSEAKVVFDGRTATVYDFNGKLVNTGSRPQDVVFAKKVAKTKGYQIEKSLDGHRQTVVLRELPFS